MSTKKTGPSSSTKQDSKRSAALADRIKRAREKKGLSQEKLAAFVGVSTDTIRKIEQKSTASPGVFLIVDIAAVLRVDLKKLVG